MGKPLYIIEEHHEAFIAWHHARIWEKGPAELIHADSHPDMSLLCSGRIPGPDACREEFADFVHNSLDIQTFITPAVFRGWFNRVTWVKPDIRKGSASATWIWKIKKGEDRLFMGKDLPESGIGKEFIYRWTGLDSPFPQADGRLVLDIDLDFFMSSPGPCPGTIEITKDEYQRYINDFRHYLRLHFGSRARVEKREGRYFLILIPEDLVHRAGIRPVGQEAAAKSIEAFGAWLTRNHIDPEFISICRSRISGFAPKGQWEFLEHSLIRLLESIYGDFYVIEGDSLF